MSMRSIEAMHNLDASVLDEILSAVVDYMENVEEFTPSLPKIKPIDGIPNGSYRTGGLEGLTKWDIEKRLGFAPNAEDDPEKVVNSWAFTVDGDMCAIWDYKGSHLFNRWSCYDPTGALLAVFDASNIDDKGW